MFKKIFFLLLGCLILSILTENVLAQTPICTPDDLDSMRLDLSGSYYLTCDLDMTGWTFEPIGHGNEPFTGEFNGNGFTISNFNVVGGGFVGLFGATENAVVHDVVFENSSVVGSSNAAVGVGRQFGGQIYNLTFRNCTATVSNQWSAIAIAHMHPGSEAWGIVVEDSMVFGALRVGAITGSTHGAFLHDSEAHNVVLTGNTYIGSCGYSQFDQILGYPSVIQNVHVTGIEIVVNGDTYTGLLVARSEGDLHIYDCSVQGTINSERLVGGILGYADGAVDIRRCYADVILNTDNGGADYNGGICGRTAPGTVILDCQSITTQTGTGQYVAGIVGNMEASRMERCASIVNIFSTSTQVGGGVGIATFTNGGSIMRDCYAMGNIQADGLAAVGGFIGGGSSPDHVFERIWVAITVNAPNGAANGPLFGVVNISEAEIGELYYDSDVAGIAENYYSSIAIQLSTQQMQLVNTFDHWPDYWVLQDGNYPTLRPGLPSDIDGDGFVDVDDLTQLILDWGERWGVSDVNFDGWVDVDDLTEIILNWN